LARVGTRKDLNSTFIIGLPSTVKLPTIIANGDIPYLQVILAKAQFPDHTVSVEKWQIARDAESETVFHPLQCSLLESIWWSIIIE